LTKPLDPGPETTPAYDNVVSPAPQAAESAGTSDSSTLPMLPIAGAVSLVAIAGMWQFVAAKKAAGAAVQSGWNIPHGGTRPPQ
jgi:hypothetical protein